MKKKIIEKKFSLITPFLAVKAQGESYYERSKIKGRIFKGPKFQKAEMSIMPKNSLDRKMGAAGHLLTPHFMAIFSLLDNNWAILLWEKVPCYCFWKAEIKCGLLSFNGNLVLIFLIFGLIFWPFVNSAFQVSDFRTEPTLSNDGHDMEDRNSKDRHHKAEKLKKRPYKNKEHIYLSSHSKSSIDS